MSGPKLDDLRAAKKALSDRCLRMGAPPPLVATFSLEDARAAAGRQIHAIGIGRKRVEGKNTSTRCVRVHVLQKLPDALVAPENRIPSEINGIPTDVVVSPRAFLLAGACVARTVPQRPLRGGIGISGPRTTAGTLGCFVRLRNGDPGAFLLTCSHVLADAAATRADRVVQPALADGGTLAGHAVAELDRWTSVLGESEIEVDAALALLLDQASFEPEICGLPRPQGTRAPEIGLGVQRRGRSTLAAGPAVKGRISDRDLDVSVAVPGGGAIVYQDHFLVKPIQSGTAFSESGDSGSLILERNGPRAVGLLVAGDPGGSYAVATPIRRVLDRFKVDLV